MAKVIDQRNSDETGQRSFEKDLRMKRPCFDADVPVKGKERAAPSCPYRAPPDAPERKRKSKGPKLGPKADAEAQPSMESTQTIPI